MAALPSWSGAIYSYFTQETLVLPLLGAALWATWRCRRKRDTRSFLLAVAVWMFAGLTRGICIPLGAVAMTWIWLAQEDKLKKAVFSIAILLAVLGPLAGRSWSLARLVSPHGIGQLAHLYYRAGVASMEIEFTRNSGRERWSYTIVSPSVNHAPLAPFSEWKGRREGRSKLLIDLDAGPRDWQAALDSLPRWDLERVTWMTYENIVQFLFAPSWPDSNLEHDPGRTIGKINYWSRWIWAPLIVICALATFILWRRRR